MAWAYFQDGALKDCRVRNFRDLKPSARASDLTVPYLIGLLDDIAPHALIVPRIAGGGVRRRSSNVGKVIRAVVREAISRGIAVHVLSAEMVKESFRLPDGTAAKNKQDIHRMILERFPELTVLVPRPRLKIWQPEQYFTPLFDAVAMYMAWIRVLSDSPS